MYLEELQSELTGTWVHVSTICHAVQHLGLTRKKEQRISLQYSEELQLQFMAEISMFDPEMIIWVDETGSARRNSVISYGYSLKECVQFHVSLGFLVKRSMPLEPC